MMILGGEFRGIVKLIHFSSQEGQLSVSTLWILVLLVDATRSWKVEDLSKEAKVSIGQVSKVKKLLAERERISSKRGGFRLAQPEVTLHRFVLEKLSVPETLTGTIGIR